MAGYSSESFRRFIELRLRRPRVAETGEEAGVPFLGQGRSDPLPVLSYAKAYS
jgi:hypothetical protein